MNLSSQAILSSLIYMCTKTCIILLCCLHETLKVTFTPESCVDAGFESVGRSTSGDVCLFISDFISQRLQAHVSLNVKPWAPKLKSISKTKVTSALQIARIIFNWNLPSVCYTQSLLLISGPRLRAQLALSAVGAGSARTRAAERDPALHLEMLCFIKSVCHQLFDVPSLCALLRRNKNCCQLKWLSTSEVLNVGGNVHLRINEMWYALERKQKFGLMHRVA